MPTKLSKITKLNYLKPRLSPHGLSGIIHLFLGLLLLFDALKGDLSKFKNGSILLILYWISCITMCFGAIFIIKQAEPKFRFIFKYTAFIQLTLCYFSYRFSIYFDNNNNDKIIFYTQITDFIFGFLFILFVPILIIYSYLYLTISASLCYIALLSIEGYIIPITFYGQKYIDCVSEIFPLQNIGFVAYVFNAIITILSFCMFAVTLWLRKIINSKNAFPIFFIPIFSVLISTILMQEIFIPNLSTQRLIIFCPRPQSNSIKDQIESYFNISTLAQYTLKQIGVTDLL